MQYLAAPIAAVCGRRYLSFGFLPLHPCQSLYFCSGWSHVLLLAPLALSQMLDVEVLLLVGFKEVDVCES